MRKLAAGFLIASSLVALAGCTKPKANDVVVPATTETTAENNMSAAMTNASDNMMNASGNMANASGNMASATGNMTGTKAKDKVDIHGSSGGH